MYTTVKKSVYTTVKKSAYTTVKKNNVYTTVKKNVYTTVKKTSTPQWKRTCTTQCRTPYLLESASWRLSIFPSQMLRLFGAELIKKLETKKKSFLPSQRYISIYSNNLTVTNGSDFLIVPIRLFEFWQFLISLPVVCSRHDFRSSSSEAFCSLNFPLCLESSRMIISTMKKWLMF